MANEKSFDRYVLLMRHGKHEAKSTPQGPQRQLTKDAGVKETHDVAEGLGYVLNGEVEGRSFIITAIRHAPSDESRQTAALVQRALGDSLTRAPWAPAELVADLDLAAEHRDMFRTPKNLGDLIERLKGYASPQVSPAEDLDSATRGSPNERKAFSVLIVGHQPLLAWIAHELVGAPVPISHSEIICVSLDAQRRGSPEWVLAPTDKEALEDLRDKIKSKMDVAKLLGGFITVGLGFLLSTFADEAKVEFLKGQVWTVGVAAVFLFVAAAMYLATMYAYDSLLMPKRFWAETPTGWHHRPPWIVARPPSPAQWVLYQNMIHIWNWMFTPATYAVGIALLLLGYAAVGPKEHVFAVNSILVVFLLTGLAVAGSLRLPELRLFWNSIPKELALSSKLRFVFGPWLGSED